jgi:hypothetical protein
VRQVAEFFFQIQQGHHTHTTNEVFPRLYHHRHWSAICLVIMNHQ